LSRALTVFSKSRPRPAMVLQDVSEKRVRRPPKRRAPFRIRRTEFMGGLVGKLQPGAARTKLENRFSKAACSLFPPR
jgi:hypothetical protein